VGYCKHDISRQRARYVCFASFFFVLLYMLQHDCALSVWVLVVGRVSRAAVPSLRHRSFGEPRGDPHLHFFSIRYLSPSSCQQQRSHLYLPERVAHASAIPYKKKGTERCDVLKGTTHSFSTHTHTHIWHVGHLRPSTPPPSPLSSIHLSRSPPRLPLLYKLRKQELPKAHTQTRLLLLLSL
jgi:hypothetical protein